MRAELVLMGRRVDMASQARRRTLVVILYAGMTVMMGGFWFVDHWRATGIYVLWAGVAACRVFLGGYYHGGLIKAFNNKAPRRQQEAPSLLALGLRVYNPLPDDDDRPFCNDERELTQRDRAHYLAYQALSMAIVIPWATSYLRMVHPGWLNWMGLTANESFYGLMLAIVIMTFTLPQAILLWTEPDMAELSE